MISGVLGVLGSFFKWLLQFLPDSWVAAALSERVEDIDAILDVIGYINYFLPLDVMSTILGIWIPAMFSICVFMILKNHAL